MPLPLWASRREPRSILHHVRAQLVYNPHIGTQVSILFDRCGMIGGGTEISSGCRSNGFWFGAKPIGSGVGMICAGAMMIARFCGVGRVDRAAGLLGARSIEAAGCFTGIRRFGTVELVRSGIPMARSGARNVEENLGPRDGEGEADRRAREDRLSESVRECRPLEVHPVLRVALSTVLCRFLWRQLGSRLPIISLLAPTIKVKKRKDSRIGLFDFPNGGDRLNRPH